jgi:hypothetical protein
MHKVFEEFPKEFGVIVVLLTIQQYIYNTVGGYARSLEVLEWYDEYFSLINGIALIIGGFLANNYSDFRLILRNTMFGIIGGGILVYTNSVFGSLLGIILFQITNCIFFITIFIRVGQYITSVNSLKIKSFLFITFLHNIPLMIIYLIGMTFLALDFQKGKFVLLSLGIIAALYLIDKLKLSIIPKPTVGQKNSNFIFILIGAIFISILGSLAIEFSQIMEPPENQDKSIFLLVMVISLIIFGGVIYWVFRKNKKVEIDLIKLLIWGFSILMLLYLVDFVFFRFDYQSIIALIFTLSYFNYGILFLPVLLTILTHNYLEQQKGIVLGVFFGFTFLGGYFFTLNFDINSHQYFSLIMISIILLIIPFLLKYRKELEDILRLKLPQEIDPVEEELADPFDHLIEE